MIDVDDDVRFRLYSSQHSSLVLLILLNKRNTKIHLPPPFVVGGPYISRVQRAAHFQPRPTPAPPVTQSPGCRCFLALHVVSLFQSRENNMPCYQRGVWQPPQAGWALGTNAAGGHRDLCRGADPCRQLRGDPEPDAARGDVLRGRGVRPGVRSTRRSPTPLPGDGPGFGDLGGAVLNTSRSRIRRGVLPSRLQIPATSSSDSELITSVASG